MGSQYGERALVFLWENFGPMHADRCDAVARSGQHAIGLELFGRSDTYDWIPESGEGFEKVTLFPTGRPRGWKLLRALWGFRRQQGRAIWFLCHYDWMEIFVFAIILRLMGDRVFTMADSKFDDFPRRLRRELGKWFVMLPYQGALACGSRSKDYLRFLGVPEKQIVGEYDTLSLARIRRQVGAPPAPDGVPFEARHFTIIARHVPKKNLPMALRAFAFYRAQDPQPRTLHLCGSGPLEPELRRLASELGIGDAVIFHGFIQTADISRILATTLALILPSTEEQFGLVVIEAQAMGLPVILSDNCGARDRLVRSAVNGFVVEPDNPEGLAWFMLRLATERVLWRRMCESTGDFAPLGDVGSFAAGMDRLIRSFQVADRN